MRLFPVAAVMLLWSAAAHAAYQMTPFTIGWAFPSAATYAAGIADNGIGLSAYNTTAGLTITLPANSTTLPPGWHLCAANDNGKVATVQVNATNGGKILLPVAGAVTSITLASGNYETACLQSDSSGGNFRLLWLTPKSAVALGVAGYVTGPGTSTDGWVATWSGTSGTVLATGHPVANLGANTVVETDANGHIDASVLNIAASGSGGKIVCANAGSLYLGSATSC